MRYVIRWFRSVHRRCGNAPNKGIPGYARAAFAKKISHLFRVLIVHNQRRFACAQRTTLEQYMIRGLVQ
jgi:hypothetical protein